MHPPLNPFPPHGLNVRLLKARSIDSEIIVRLLHAVYRLHASESKFVLLLLLQEQGPSGRMLCPSHAPGGGQGADMPGDAGAAAPPPQQPQPLAAAGPGSTLARMLLPADSAPMRTLSPPTISQGLSFGLLADELDAAMGQAGMVQRGTHMDSLFPNTPDLLNQIMDEDPLVGPSAIEAMLLGETAGGGAGGVGSGMLGLNQDVARGGQAGVAGAARGGAAEEGRAAAQQPQDLLRAAAAQLQRAASPGNQAQRQQQHFAGGLQGPGWPAGQAQQQQVQHHGGGHGDRQPVCWWLVCACATRGAAAAAHPRFGWWAMAAAVASQWPRATAAATTPPACCVHVGQR